MMWRDANRPASGRGGGERGVARLVGESEPMRELKTRNPRVAAAPFPVVIDGETGTGKELVARAIHEEGPRAWAVFVPVNCAALGDELFESELFGHARGAFTGAAQDHKGLLELSSGGTVFLDEVAELTPAPRRSCSACCRTARSAASARTAPSGSTCGSSPPRSARSTPRPRPAGSAGSCSTASAS